MACVYILYSNQLDKFYIGSCKALGARIKQHQENEYSKCFTTKANDWELFYSIDNLGYQQARKIEAHIKRMRSKTYILNLKQYTDIMNKLKDKYND